MAEVSKEVRSEGLEQGSVKPSSAPENVRFTGPDLTWETKFVQEFSRQIGRRFGTHRPSLGTAERVSSPEIQDETYQGSMGTFKEGAD